MAGKKGNKKHANKTSFTSESRTGVPAYEKWTEETTEIFFNQALELSKQDHILSLEALFNELNIYDEIMLYLIKKFPKFSSFEKLIKNQIIARINKGALTKEYDSSFSKFNLSANYGWKEKSESDQNIRLIPPKIGFKE